MNDYLKVYMNDYSKVYEDGPTFEKHGFRIIKTKRPPQNEDPRGPFTRGRGPIGWKLRRIRWRRKRN